MTNNGSHRDFAHQAATGSHVAHSRKSETSKQRLLKPRHESNERNRTLSGNMTAETLNAE